MCCAYMFGVVFTCYFAVCCAGWVLFTLLITAAFLVLIWCFDCVVGFIIGFGLIVV